MQLLHNSRCNGNAGAAQGVKNQGQGRLKLKPTRDVFVFTASRLSGHLHCTLIILKLQSDAKLFNIWRPQGGLTHLAVTANVYHHTHLHPIWLSVTQTINSTN